MRRLSVVIPLHNEAENIGPLVRALHDALKAMPGLETEMVLVDDGSTDSTASALLQLSASVPGVKAVSLLRNVGHQHALMAGIEAATGDAILTMDGDGQHPPEVAAQMATVWMNQPGLDIVQTVRKSGQSPFKERTAAAFYRLVNLLVPEVRLVPGAGDFRLVSQRVRAVMLSRPECARNIRVFLAQYRFPTHLLPYVCAPRWNGNSKYSLRKMIRLACDGIFAFTHFPLRLNLVIASALLVFGLSFLLYTLVAKFRGDTVSGWTSLVGLVCILFSGVFTMLAVISEYIILIHEGVQEALSRRPQDRTTPRNPRSS